MKVLIVDDSAKIRERLVLMLEDIEGIEVAGQAEDVPGALVMNEWLKPDAIILDIRIHKGSGFEVLERVKRRTRPPIVIMFTNFAYPKYRERCLQSGADYFFGKSEEFEKIPEVLGALANSSV
ncbi:MAG TPA: response regulator transcription factor [Candidatus Anoxymicrobiaceae bacterium]|jgi:DNA-binding NarL/FixJ family response regulator